MKHRLWLLSFLSLMVALSVGVFSSLAAGLGILTLKTPDIVTGTPADFGTLTDDTNSTGIRFPANTSITYILDQEYEVSDYYEASWDPYITVDFLDSADRVVGSFKTKSTSRGEKYSFSAVGVKKIRLTHDSNPPPDTINTFNVVVKVPSKPVTGLGYTEVDDTTIRLNWALPVDPSRYQILVYRGSTLIGTLPSGDVKFEVQNYSFDKSETFTVYTTSSSGVRSSPETLNIPAKITGLVFAVDKLTDKSVSFTFSGKNVKDYDLYRDGELIKTLPYTFRSYTDYGLSPSTTYTYKLVAKNDGGSLEQAINVTTLAEPPPPPPPPPPEPLPEPPTPTPIPVPDVDTGNEDLDSVTENMLDGGNMMKNGGVILIFWAVAIAVVLLGARWLWKIFRQWMASARGSGGSSGGSSGVSNSGSNSGSGGGSGDRSSRTYTHNGKEYKVYEGSYDQRERVNKNLGRFQ